MSTADPNPYSAPHTPVDKPGPAPRSRLLLAVAWAATLLLTGLAAAAPNIIGAFRQIYSSFGADLSKGTLLIMAAPWIWSGFPIVALMLAVDAQRRARHEVEYRRAAAMRIGVLLLLAFIGFSVAVFLLYQPVFKLGQPV